jgi:hypothetical protein
MRRIQQRTRTMTLHLDLSDLKAILLGFSNEHLLTAAVLALALAVLVQAWRNNK